MRLTYENSGVNINVADAAKKEMAIFMEANTTERVMNKTGAFASLYDFSNISLLNPVLVLKTEEPGTKQLLAFKFGKIKNICYDMINHLVNDIIVMGATPLTVQDAIICGKIEKDVVTQVVKYVAEACKSNGCVLTGGETSEQPGMLKEGTYVLTSSIVGLVDKRDIIDGSKIVEGDVVLALASNGIHTNGYSFLRKMMENDPDIINEKIDGVSFLDAILESHKSYFNELKPLFGNRKLVGMAHITGGGISGNLDRILPEDADAIIDLEKINVLNLFKFIKSKTQSSNQELLKTFNMGVGMVLVVKAEASNEFINYFQKSDLNCYTIGKIVKGCKKVHYINDFQC